MEIDIKKEAAKVKKEMRKVGDKSGIGFDMSTNKSNKKSYKEKFEEEQEENYEGQRMHSSVFDQRVMKEAELLLSGKAD